MPAAQGIAVLRIWSWNINGLDDPWNRLVPDEVDIALLQEARLPAQAWQRPVAPDPGRGMGHRRLG